MTYLEPQEENQFKSTCVLRSTTLCKNFKEKLKLEHGTKTDIILDNGNRFCKGI